MKLEMYELRNLSGLKQCVNIFKLLICDDKHKTVVFYWDFLLLNSFKAQMNIRNEYDDHESHTNLNGNYLTLSDMMLFYQHTKKIKKIKNELFW